MARTSGPLQLQHYLPSTRRLPRWLRRACCAPFIVFYKSPSPAGVGAHIMQVSFTRWGRSMPTQVSFARWGRSTPYATLCLQPCWAGGLKPLITECPHTPIMVIMVLRSHFGSNSTTHYEAAARRARFEAGAPHCWCARRRTPNQSIPYRCHKLVHS